MIIGKYPSLRLRRSRKESWSRRLIQENTLSPNDFILPIFLIEGSNKRQEISSMPGVYRYTINRLSQIVDRAIKKKIPMVALFPKTKNVHKDELGTESLNEKNLVCRAIKEIKKRYKNQIGIMCDVALDPYTSHGHDGLIKSKTLSSFLPFKSITFEFSTVILIAFYPFFCICVYYICRNLKVN